MNNALTRGTVGRLVTIQIAKHYLTFAAGHFTIFSATKRERLHGHSFRLRAEALAQVDDNGLTFDYVPLKRCLKELCDELDEHVLFPAHSPHLEITTAEGSVTACFNKHKIILPAGDVLILPIKNTTVEELSYYFLERLLEVHEEQLRQVKTLKIGVSSGLGQWGEACWTPP